MLPGDRKAFVHRFRHGHLLDRWQKRPFVDHFLSHRGRGRRLKARRRARAKARAAPPKAKRRARPKARRHGPHVRCTCSEPGPCSACMAKARHLPGMASWHLPSQALALRQVERVRPSDLQ